MVIARLVSPDGVQARLAKLGITAKRVVGARP
jgi:hypothetical protein